MKPILSRFWSIIPAYNISVQRSINSVPKWPTLKNPWIEEIFNQKPAFVPPQNEMNYIKSPEDFFYVKKLLPQRRIPPPPAISKEKGEMTPSGWIPPSATIPNLPYFVRRTKNHMLPIAFEEKYRKKKEETHGVRQITVIWLITGDLWALEKELRVLLEPLAEGHLLTQVDEVRAKIRIEGIFLKEVSEFLLSKGF